MSGGSSFDRPMRSVDESEKIFRSNVQEIEEISRGEEKTSDQPKSEYKENRIREMIASSNPNEIGIVYLNVGQGDATIVRLPNGKVMVIDCNTDEAPENIIKYLKEANIKKIDYLIITHPHADHMSGTKQIADHFEVGDVWTADYTRHKNEESPESYEKYRESYIAGLQKMERDGTRIKTPVAKNEPIVQDGKLEIRILAPSRSVQGENEDIHNESLALQIQFGKTSFVFTGDTTNEQQSRIVNYYPIKGATIWHASHHGSINGANEDVMREVRPQYTVIPVGKGNPHQHPHDDALDIYKKNTQKRVYRTDKGNIGFRFNANGDCIEVQE